MYIDMDEFDNNEELLVRNSPRPESLGSWQLSPEDHRQSSGGTGSPSQGLYKEVKIWSQHCSIVRVAEIRINRFSLSTVMINSLAFSSRRFDGSNFQPSYA